MKRRDFLKLSATSLGALGAAGAGATPTASAAESPATFKPARVRGKSKYNAEYSCARLNRIAFPLGGMGAGMICLGGSGALSHVSLRNRPEVFNEPMTFGALCVKGEPNVTRVLEGPDGMCTSF